MPGETAEDISGWTIDTAMMHFSRRFQDLSEKLDERAVAQETAMNTALSAQQLAVSAAMASAKEAVAKAEESSNKRFESVNEFRAQLADQSATFATKIQVDLVRESMTDRLADLTKRVDMNTSRLDASSGKSQGINAAWAVGIAVLGALLGISGFVFAIIQMVSQ